MKILSPYVHYFYDSDGNILILETLSGNIIKINKDRTEKFIQAINNPNILEDDNILVIQKVFIEDNINCEEINQILYQEFLEKKDKLYLIILPTEFCNFRCIYCYEEHKNKIMNENTIDAILQFVDKNIDQYKSLSVGWFGGEPLCARSVVEKLSEMLIEICKKHKKPYIANMTTNGYELNDKVFKKMLGLKILNYQITLDGCKESHDLQRVLFNGNGTYDVILNNLRNIRDNIKSKYFTITIRCNITSNNYSQFAIFLEEMAKDFGNDKRFNFIWKLAWNPKKEENSIYLNDIAMKQILFESRKRNLDISYIRYQMKKYGSICYASDKNSFVIGVDGKIYKCTVHFEEEINCVGYLTKDGNMNLDEEKLSFWTGENIDNTKRCMKCFYYPCCMGIFCMASKIHSNKREVCPDLKYCIDDFVSCFSNDSIQVKDFSFN